MLMPNGYFDAISKSPKMYFPTLSEIPKIIGIPIDNYFGNEFPTYNRRLGLQAILN